MTPRPPLSVWTYTVRNARKILPTLIILTFVVMIVIVILSTLRGLKDGTLIFAREFNHFTVVIPKKKDVVGEELKEQIRAHPSVERVVESRNCMFQVRALIARIPFQIRALSQEDMEYVVRRVGVPVLRGRLPGKGTNEVALHEIFMRANGWDLEQEFGMDVSDEDWMPGRFRVVGILGGETPTNFASLEYFSSPLLYFYSAKLWQRVLVFAKPGREEEMSAYLRSIGQIRVWDRARAEHDISQSFDRLLLIVDFVSILQIAVVALVVGLLHNIFFGQRTDEFAILLAVGHTQRRLLRKVVLETALLMALAWALGTGLSFALLAGFKAAVLDPRGIPLPLFQPVPVLVSMAMPLVAQVFATATVFGRLRRLDPIQIIERRG
ncbi:MAG: ABC transporter permease [Planctomycetes bacterium]|nr:ABC transporter permease [Planctomycetota bacterium]